MTPDLLVLLIVLGLGAVLLLLGFRLSAEQARLRVLAEQALAGQRGDGETMRAALQRATADMAERLAELRGEQATAIETLRTLLTREQGDLRLALAEGLARAREQASAAEAAQGEATRALLEAKLGEIQKGVNEQLHAAVEKQMTESFARVIDQFTAVQKAMADVQAVTGQIGDLKRLFANVKTRGLWGETQLRAMLDDILPAGAYETNRKTRPDSDEAVEFAVRMPIRGENAPLLPVDAKFPMEDYERMLLAAEAADAEGERQARRALERRVREEARKIAEKYINPPVTVEFAVLYLPTDGLYAEIARAPGLIEDLGRTYRVLVLGPSLFPALLRTIHMGFVTLALEQKADEVRLLLGVAKTEMARMDGLLERLLKQAGTFASTIEQARRRTRVVGSRLRQVADVELDSGALALDEAAEPEADSGT
jgi:DNA recombination protein RmuC